VQGRNSGCESLPWSLIELLLVPCFNLDLQAWGRSFGRLAPIDV